MVFTSLFWAIGLILALQPILSSYVPGANDNGIGAAMVLNLANKYKNVKFNNIDIFFLNNSNEESVSKSVTEWARDLKLDKRKTLFLNLDAFASGQLTITGKEADDIGFSVKYDKLGYDFVLDLWKGNSKYYSLIKELEAPVSTDANPLVKEGYRVLVTLGSMSKTGSDSNYHQHTDTIDKIHWESVLLCEEFVNDLVLKIDKNWEKLQ